MNEAQQLIIERCRACGWVEDHQDAWRDPNGVGGLNLWASGQVTVKTADGSVLIFRAGTPVADVLAAIGPQEQA